MPDHEVAALLAAKIKRHPTLPPPPLRRALRIGRGLTLDELADVLGVTRGAVGNYETGRRTPRGPLLERYAEALRVLQEAA